MRPDDLTVLGEDFKEMGRRFVEAREVRDADAEKAKASEAVYREQEQEVWMRLDESPLEGDIKIDLGAPYGVVSFGSRETYYGREREFLEGLRYEDKFPDSGDACPYCGRPEGGLTCDDDHCREA